MAMWHSFVRRFIHRYRIVLFDYPDQGGGRVVDGPLQLSLDEQVGILGAVIDATNGTEPVHVCSASWGGVIAMAYAVGHPERLKSLILASIGTRANQRMIDIITHALAMPAKDGLEVAETLIKCVGQDLPEAMKNRIVNQFSRMGTDALQAFSQHGSTVISVCELSEVVDVSKVQCRTIIVHGENDAIIDLDDVKFLASQIRCSELKLIKNVGHFLHLENENLLDDYEDILASVC
jgi:pimeloyl-ACP methyl ester carboxylesterase